MKTENIVLAGLLVLVVGGLVFTVAGLLKENSGTAEMPSEKEGANNALAKPGFKSVPSGSTGSGDVSVVLTPEKISNGRLEVEIDANTHSVDLNQFDLKQIATLEYDGKAVAPVSAPVLSGHHASGKLVFDVDGEIGDFVIRIRGMPRVEERTFAWP